MSRLDEIEKAVEQLSAQELDVFRRWFEAFDAARFDDKIEADATSGRLDDLAATALREFRDGRVRPL